jgi:hypothetical protein
VPVSEAKGNRPPPFSVSIVIEWENAGRIGNERAERMLRTLHAQLREADPSLIDRAEVIFAFPGNGSDEAAVRSTVAAATGGAEWSASIRTAPAPCDGYYELKNFGAELAQGEIIAFLDSDVIPQPNWLESLISTFRNPEAEIVSGATWVDYRGLYSAAMALGWIFPVPPEDASITRVKGFAANNLAFRTELRSVMHFPDCEQYRGQGTQVIERLRAEGRTILLNRGAQVSHPPPAMSHFLTRALWSGYDLAVNERRRGGFALGRGVRDVGRTGAIAIHAVATRFRRVKLGPAGAVGAGFVVAAYHGLRGVGLLAGLAAPRLLQRTLKRIAP